MERAIGYIRTGFFAGRTFTDLEDLNAQADAWCGGLAAARSCPEEPAITVGEALVRERERLIALPDTPWPIEERVEVRVGKTPYARFDLNDYSVPHAHVSRTLTVLASGATVRVLDGAEELARHARSWGRGEQIEREEHVAELVAAKASAREHRGQDRLARAARPRRCSSSERPSGARRSGASCASSSGCSRSTAPPSSRAAVAEALERGVPHSNAVRLALERRREVRGLPPSLAVPLTPDVRARDVLVRPVSLADYDRLAPDTDNRHRHRQPTPTPTPTPEIMDDD